jgi:hypothetical protein
MPNTYEVKIQMQGKAPFTTTVTVTAPGATQARQLVQAQYNNAKILYVKQVK